MQRRKVILSIFIILSFFCLTSIISAMKIPNDELFYDTFTHRYTQWNLGPSTYCTGTINACEAWEYTTGSSDVVVAVIDTGFDLGHEDLQDVWLRDSDGNILGYNGVTRK